MLNAKVWYTKVHPINSHPTYSSSCSNVSEKLIKDVKLESGSSTFNTFRFASSVSHEVGTKAIRPALFLINLVFSFLVAVVFGILIGNVNVVMPSTCL